MRGKRILLIFTAVCAFALSLQAQVTVKVQAPNLVGEGEQFNVSFVVDGEDKPSSFVWDAGENFSVVWGPQQGYSSRTSIVNGTRTKSEQHTYTYILVPSKVGEFTIPQAEVTIKGKKYYSETPTIKVVKDEGGSNGQAEPSTKDNPPSQGSDGAVSADDIILRFTVSKTNIMVGESVTASLKLYQRVNLSGLEGAKFPTFNGFWSEETYIPSNVEFHRETLNGKIYNTATLRNWTLVPQQTGELHIDPAELVCLINLRVSSPSTGSIFDSFFEDDYRTVRKRVTSSPVTIKVSSLPSGAPSSFGGGVGKFKMSAALTRDSLKTHEAASLKLTITGSGNVALLEAPKVNFPPDFESYDVRTSDVQGGKVFEYPFIPRSHGDFEIPPVEYSYFDISSHRYETLRSAPLRVAVSKGETSSSDTLGGKIITGTIQKDVREIGSDIRFISTKTPKLYEAGSFFVGTAGFYLIAVGLLLCAALAYLLLRRREELRSDVLGTRSRGAVKMARKRLSDAKLYLGKNLYSAFYEELHRALLGYVSDKLGLDAADMSKDNIVSRLSERGVSEELRDELLSLIDACEFARYAPSEGAEAMNTHYEKAVAVISSIDDSMKRTGVKKNTSSSLPVIAALLLTLAGAGESLNAADRGRADSLWNAGVEAYSAGAYRDAVAVWSEIAEAGKVSPELYCNLGDAFFKSGDIPHAILNYERALKLDPSHKDAAYNLNFANSLIQDKIESVPDFFLVEWGRSLSYILSSDAWGKLSLAFLTAALAMLLLFLLGKRVPIKRTGFILAIVAAVLSLSCFFLATSQKAAYNKSSEAIVVSAVATVKSSPSESDAKDLFVLHEGTKVKVLDSLGDWRNIELSDGREGWMRYSSLEAI